MSRPYSKPESDPGRCREPVCVHPFRVWFETQKWVKDPPGESIPTEMLQG